jgi:hypothetical protein
MPDESKTPDRPIAGLIQVEGQWYPRGRGFLTQRELRCMYGHRIQAEGRPFEIALPCGSIEMVGADRQRVHDKSAKPCDAFLYIISTRGRHFWAMDLTKAEAGLIAQLPMDFDQMLEFFGVGFPPGARIVRKKS